MKPWLVCALLCALASTAGCVFSKPSSCGATAVPVNGHGIHPEEVESHDR